MSHRSSDGGTFVLGGAVVLVAWLFVGVPIFNQLVQQKGVLWAYSLFLLLVGVSFGYIGEQTLGAGLTVSMAALAVFIIGDIVTPPILIPWAGVVPLPPEAALSSDLFFYTLFTQVVHLPHQLAWLATYLGAPILLILLVLHVYGLEHGKSQILKGLR